jgi:hypothetical protein
MSARGQHPTYPLSGRSLLAQFPWDLSFTH